MDWLKSSYPKIREILRASTPDYWPELRSVWGGLLDGPMTPETSLPLAACRAVGGRAEDAEYVAASVVAAAVSLRTLDDLEDQDRPGRLWDQVGPARAWNYASVVNVLTFDILCRSPLAREKIISIHHCFADTFLRVAYGQELDLAGRTRTVEDYWLTIEHKAGWAFAGACAAGAMAGTDDAELIRACGAYGFHLGLAIQILNDMDSIWLHEGVTDLKQGKVTLPLLYGLTADHPERAELRDIVSSGQVAARGERVKEILERLNVRQFLWWSALKERGQALEAVRPCPDAEGRAALESYVTGMFGDIDSQTPAEGECAPPQEARQEAMQEAMQEVSPEGMRAGR